jgi:hypothetical protein
VQLAPVEAMEADTSSGLDKASNMIGTSFGTTGTAEVFIHAPLIAKDHLSL